MRYYFHGSYHNLKLGTIMKGRGEEYKKQWSTLGPIYDTMDKMKPEGKLSHYEGVFMCSDNGDNDFGLNDIDMCGAATDYIFRVVPRGPVQKHDMNWMTQALCIADELDILEDDENQKYIEDVEKHNQKINNLKKDLYSAIQSYWDGESSKEPLWEYITSSVEIVETGEFDNYKFIKPKVSLLYESQLMEYLELDNFIEDSRLKYVYPNSNTLIKINRISNGLENITQEYLCVFSNDKLDGDNPDNYSKMIGILVMGRNSNGHNVLYGVSVDKEYQNQGIGKTLINSFFDYSLERELPVVISSYSKEGELYAKPLIDNRLKSYPIDFLKKKISTQIDSHLKI